MGNRYAPLALGCCLLLVATGRAAEPPAQPVEPAPGKSTEAPGKSNGAPAKGAERAAAQASPEETVEQLTERARKSVVVITFTGRDGQRQGLGAGFVVSSDGLIATNLHVIGEARPVTVQFADGKQYDVTSVHASDRQLDLAVVRINAKNLPALPLGDVESLKQGQAVVAIGNPHGLEHSVVTGVVSGFREVDGRPMIQLAIPIEPGNSGGPLLDMHGAVHGLLTMKSVVTANLGFAVKATALKGLLEKPNPVPMSRWLTIGVLNAREWTPLFGARWRRRGGQITVEGSGQGFGGRALCLAEQRIPELPYELAVTVRLDDEGGAAGLVFCSDGEHKHYGFYPSAGKVRLTRFDGPDVFSWKVLSEEANPHYKPGEWNSLRVRVEPGKILCYVNNQLAIESTDAALTGGKVGLAKFRDTHAQFKSFRLAKEVPTEAISADQAERVVKLVDKLPGSTAPDPGLIRSLAPEGTAAKTVLRDRAKQLEQQAGQLRALASAVHRRRTSEELARALEGQEAAVDLFHAGLLISKLDNEEVDIDAYRQELERMAGELKETLPADADDQARLAALGKYLFEDNGFHGSRGDYYNRSNSYLNEVLDDREGLPITLSVLYIELAHRIGLEVAGVGLPGHFVVSHLPKKGERQLIDVYEGAKPLSREDAARRVNELAERELTDSDLAPLTKRQIVARMLHNLLSIAAERKDGEAILRYLDALVAVNPESPRERWMRAVMLYRAGSNQAAREDVDWLIEKQPADLDLAPVYDLQKLLEES